MLATWGCTTFPKPTLSLDFLGATSLDSGITFSRGSQATLFDSTGTLVYAKHNLLLQSQTFQTTWTRTGILAFGSGSIVDAAVSPDGSVTADKIVEDTSTGNHLTQQSSTSVSGFSYTLSVYAKAAERSQIRMALSGTEFTSGRQALFDLNTGVVVAVDANVVAVISFVGNGWYRCSITATATSSGTNPVTIQLGNGATTAAPQSYTGDGTSGLFLWGAQLNIANMEGGVTSSLTTYYPTTTAAYYAPRFDYNPSTLQPRGLLIEEQRTNLIRNSTGVGAVAGTPGTAPTNWVVASSATHASSIIGTGVENGINYVDIQYVVSAGALAASLIYADTPAATASTAYTGSYFLKLVSGSIPQVRFIWQDGITTVARSFFSITSSLTRYDNTYTTSVGATLARFVIGIDASAAGTTFVIRVGLPQTEQGAFATSVIPTTTTALTRNADVASMTGTNFSSWFNAAGIGTLFAQAASRSTSTANALITQIDSGSSADIFGIYHQIDEQAVFRVRIGNVNIFGTGFGTLTDGVVAKTAAAFQSGSNAACLNGGTVVSNTTSFSAPTMSVLRIGTNQISTESINGWVQRLVYYPTRLPNTTLQALTA